MTTPSVRASDSDREATANRLQDAYAAGRLTAEEHSERLDRAYAARDTHELAELTSDLPAPPPAPLRRRDKVQRLQVAAAQSATPFLICTFIWLASGAHGQFWPIWVGFPVVLRMLAALRAYGMSDEEREGRSERHRERHEERARRRGLAPPPPPRPPDL